MTDLTPDTIAETRRLLEQWNDPEVDRHSAWLVACALANHLPALLDRVEAAERALVCADAFAHHSTHDNYEDYKSARSQCPALLRGKENADPYGPPLDSAPEGLRLAHGLLADAGYILRGDEDYDGLLAVLRTPDSAPEEQDEGRTPDQSWIVALHNLRICADELNRIGHVGEARMIEDAVVRIVAFRQHIAAR